MTFEEQLKQQLGLMGYQVTQSRGPASGATRKFYNYHEGTDVGTPEGTPIIPQFKGVYLGTVNDQTGYGTREAIYNPANDQTYYLSHLSRVMNMQPGQTFDPGTTIAYTGGTPGAPGAGNTTGPHLDIVSKTGKQAPQYSYASNLVNALSGSWRNMNPQDIINKVKQQFGGKAVAVSSDINKLKEQAKTMKNARIQKVVI